MTYRALNSQNVVLPGFEPRKAESKSAVLPLHHRTVFNPNFRIAKVELISKMEKLILTVFQPFGWIKATIGVPLGRLQYCPL